MLPGAYSLPQEFVDEGFVQALRERRIAADTCIADAHLGYFSDRSVLERLRVDVIGPARRQGYRRIWLVGISLGGFGALAYGAAYGSGSCSRAGSGSGSSFGSSSGIESGSESGSGSGSKAGHGVDGVLALAPYLGRRGLLQEIAAAPSPAAWAAGEAGVQAGVLAGVLAQGQEPEAAERELWRWLVRPPAGAPPVWLGYGRDDRLGEGHRLLRQALPAERVFDVPGGHDWAPWRALWQAWLDRSLLGTDCA